MFRRGVLNTILCDKVCQWLATYRWFSSGTLVSTTNKTDNYFTITTAPILMYDYPVMSWKDASLEPSPKNTKHLSYIKIQNTKANIYTITSILNQNVRKYTTILLSTVKKNKVRKTSFLEVKICKWMIKHLEIFTLNSNQFLPVLWCLFFVIIDIWSQKGGKKTIRAMVHSYIWDIMILHILINYFCRSTLLHQCYLWDGMILHVLSNYFCRSKFLHR
jgi:hypothetical protein